MLCPVFIASTLTKLLSRNNYQRKCSCFERLLRKSRGEVKENADDLIGGQGKMWEGGRDMHERVAFRSIAKGGPVVQAIP